ncbi:MAG TPA: hypothetical protein DIT01_18000 [Lentisphaeria bacterium]|nr:hypothetical protein [Lentisphaeria bacterium]
MADNEQDQDDEPCEEAFYDSINKSGTEELNMPAMYLRRLKDVNRKFQQEAEKKKWLSPGHTAEQAEPAHETDEEIPAAPGLFASGEHKDRLGPAAGQPTYNHFVRTRALGINNPLRPRMPSWKPPRRSTPSQAVPAGV